MKSVAIVFALSVCLFSCKKEGGADQQKETLLSEIRQNGLLVLRFQYNADNLLTKLESYKSDPTDNTVQSHVDFQYNDKGHITQFTSYSMPGNVAMSKAVIEYDGSGKLIKGSSYDLQGISPNTVQSTTAYTYNGKGQVIKVMDKDKNAKLLSQYNLSYYDDGHIKERQTWFENDGALWMKRKSSFSLPNGTYDSGLDQMRVLLGSDFIARLYSETTTNLTYSAIGSITHNNSEQMSAREYNDDGTLKKQVVTTKWVKPEDDDRVILEEYVYIKQ